MRLWILLLAAATLAGCSARVDTSVSPTEPPSPTTTATETTITESSASPQPREEWKGFETTHGSDTALAVYASNGAVDVYSSSGDDEPEMTLDGTTILGTVTVLAVVAGPDHGWVEVMLPVRPNGSTGWVEVENVDLYVADSEIVVDLSQRELTYLVDGVEILRTEAGIGSDYNQTPPGTFFVTDNVTLADPNSPWGPHALGISARSETITEFNGGDGIIGIHGTNNPGSIGDNISLGCVRLPNDMITALHEMVPLGTRVTVTA